MASIGRLDWLVFIGLLALTVSVQALVAVVVTRAKERAEQGKAEAGAPLDPREAVRRGVGWPGGGYAARRAAVSDTDGPAPARGPVAAPRRTPQSVPAAVGTSSELGWSPE